MKNWLDVAANGVIAIGALTVAGIMVRREFLVRPEPELGRVFDSPPPPSFVPEWEDVMEAGLTIGPRGSPVRIAVFTDLECPVCARFHREVVMPLLAENEGKISFTIVHSPLKRHRFALQSAVALECGAAQARHAELLDAIYSKQDSIGLKPWTLYAEEAQVGDTALFLKCMSRPPVARIDAGKEWTSRLEVLGTPTVMVNGWRFHGVPSAEHLTRVIEAIQAGRTPEGER